MYISGTVIIIQIVQTLTTPALANTIGNAKLLTIQPIVKNIDSSTFEFAPVEKLSCEVLFTHNVGITDRI